MKYIKAAVLATGIIVLICLIVSFCCGEKSLKVKAEMSAPLLLIDPGHGGVDGGAVSNEGVPEKNINLQIAMKVRDAAETAGWQTVMTRESDDGLYSTGDSSIRSKKTEDLRARREMICRYRPDAAVSIHLNSFKEDPSVSGVQVFYPDGWADAALQEECRQMAEVIQKSINTAADIKKERTALPKSDVFIFREEVSPIVIVECGFLSNDNEAELLQTDRYQQILAEGIMAGITEFTGFQATEKIDVIDSSAKKNKHK